MVLFQTIQTAIHDNSEKVFSVASIPIQCTNIVEMIKFDHKESNLSSLRDSSRDSYIQNSLPPNIQSTQSNNTSLKVEPKVEP